MVKLSMTATLMDGKDERLGLEAKSPSSEASSKAGPMATQTTSGNSIFPSGHGPTAALSNVRNTVLYFLFSPLQALSSSSKLDLETEILPTESSNFL